MRPAAGDQLREHQARLDGLAETDAVGQQQAGPAHAQCPHHRHQLERRDLEPAGLCRQQGVGAECLLEQEGLVVEAPIGEAPCPCGVGLGCDGLDGLEGVQQVKLVPAQRAVRAPQAKAYLLPGRLGVRDDPAQTAGDDGRTRQNVAQCSPSPGRRAFVFSLEW